MDLDPVLLARAQFAANISFHILFPAITIGLAWLLVYFRVRYTRTRHPDWDHAYQFWVRIFALCFAIGVVSGITMSFQFGTNWPGFMNHAGNIAGPLLGYEILTAFFLEATFLGVMLFGKDRVSNGMHLLACTLVAIGTSLSAFWILALSAWMHTPAGYVIEDGILDVASWWEIIFNPSFPYRLTHMLLASVLTASFLIIGVSAWRLRRGTDTPVSLLVLRTGVLIAMIAAPAQVIVGDLHGLNTLEHQPAKIAAIEAIWETGDSVPLVLFALPDEESRSNRFALEIPYGASLILHHDPHATLQGLNEFEGEHPPVAIVFWSFRIMVATGILMVAFAWWAGWQLLVRRRPPSAALLTMASWMTFSGWVAVLAGWYVTEIGRQPWLVQGVLKTSDMVADHEAGMVLSTFVAYLALYAFVLVSFIATLRYMSVSKPRTQTAEISDKSAQVNELPNPPEDF